MDIQNINPAKLDIDPLNERNENVGPHEDQESLEESIREQGLIQPPIARRSGDQLHVVVGQRRTLAAQAVGLEEIPVIVVDWQDEEALQASITENVEAFSKRVSRTDRAEAIKKLIDITGWSIQKVADEMGVSETTIRDWLERTREGWQETSVHVDPSDESSETSSKSIETHEEHSEGINQTEVEEIPDTDLRTIRTATDSPEERESAVETVVDNELNKREIREARTRAERGGDSFDAALREISKEKQETEGSIKVHTELTFTGDYAEGLQEAARDRGTSEEEIIREAIDEYLSQSEYI